jgi:DNA primase
MDAARDFFDAHLERISLQPGFDTPRGRSAAARKLAEFLSALQDPLLRNLHVQRHAVRLGVATSELQGLVSEALLRNRAQQVSSATNRAETPRVPSEGAHASGDFRTEAYPAERIGPLDPTLELLATVLLQSQEARQWLLEEDWQRRLEAEPQGELIEAILKGSRFLDATDNSQSFFVHLPPAQERLLAALIENKPPENPLCRAQECWDELERRQLRRKIESFKSRQRDTSLSLEAAAALHQQILDLQRRLSDTTRPFSPSRQHFADRF